MTSLITRRGLSLFLASAGVAPLVNGCVRPSTPAPDALPSWNDGAAKRDILGFVAAVANDGADYVAPDERVAVFDNDGTLWVEQPAYVQMQYALATARAMMQRDPAVAVTAPFVPLAAAGAAEPHLSAEQWGALIAATHSGMTPEAFDADVRRWLETARHPRFDRPYTECVYQPMLELLDYLRRHGFKTYIVSGGGVDFMRAFAMAAYGVPPEQVIGSSGQVRFEMRDGVGVIIKQPQLGSVDDRAGKPANIALHIGRRPILAFGNSDGDLEMLQYVSTGPGRRLAALIHHDDAEREYAYDAASPVGALSVALEEAQRRRWIVVSMRRDWNRVLPSVRAAPIRP